MSVEVEKLRELLESKVKNSISGMEIRHGDLTIRVKREQLLNLFNVFKIDADLQFDFLVNVTAVDWLDKASERFEVIYHLLSFKKLHRIRVKVWVSEEQPEIDSVVSLWNGANFMEREVWDMYGIRFLGHPDLRRILMYDEFEGHPLRKDYPVQGKQPRVKMRAPEVRNTAQFMDRPSLVQINKPKKELAGTNQGARV